MNWDLVVLGVIITLTFLLGWFGHGIYSDYVDDVKYRGLWIKANYTQAQALEASREFDSQGSWICINIRGITIPEMIETCEHEAGHEIFAQKCAGKARECLERVTMNQ